MIFQNTVLKDCFGHNYLLTAQKNPSNQLAASPMNFADAQSAGRFLKGFGCDESYWRRIARELGAISGPTDAPMCAVSVKLFRGQVNVYKLPANYGSTSTTGEATFSKANSNDCFEIAPAASAVMATKAIPQVLPNVERATAMLKSLNMDSKKLAALSENLTGASVSGDTEQLTARLAQCIAKGDLVVLNHGPRRAPMVAVVVESAASMAGNRQVPLAPETENWIEVKLLDEDGEPVADQKYWIKDAEGAEYEGKTDAKGVARLDKIATGDCEISFIDLEGWS